MFLETAIKQSNLFVRYLYRTTNPQTYSSWHPKPFPIWS
jgi:hypothetical protein